MCDIKRRSFLGSSATLLGGGLIAGQEGHAQKHAPSAPGSMHDHVHTVSAMTETANRLLAALSPEQKAKAVFPFQDEERFHWFYVPIDRKGLTLGEMSPYQRHLASALLASGLSQAGYIKAVTIMSLEDVLRVMENDSGVRRNPEKYHFTIFGAPADAGTWGYRVEGPPYQPELYCDERAGGGWSELFRLQPGRGQARAAQRTARARPGRRSGI
jgi:hypothetical protein